MRAYLDLDIDGHRAAHERARAFIAATNLRYGWSSPDLAQLGGSERARVEELYSSDHEWGSRGRIALSACPHERLELRLWPHLAPNAVDNFLSLCRGNRGLAKGSGRPLHYLLSPVHRVVPGFMMQGGDFVAGNGAGGESVWGGVFKDERGGLAVKVDRRGLLCMSNSGKNSNSSQFFITFAGRASLSGKHVVFGEVDLPRCEAALAAVEAVGGGVDERPKVPVQIVGCGVLDGLG